MKKKSVLLSLLILVATMMLSGCLYPYWGDGGGYGHDGGRGGEHRDGGHREGGERH